MIGSLIESTIQPFIKELYCLAAIANGRSIDPSSVVAADFGKAVDGLDRLLGNNNFLSPEPWGVRLNQWRNIAQHHSYKAENDLITAQYGKRNPPKQFEVTRDDIYDVLKELVRRLGALKSSRELMMLHSTSCTSLVMRAIMSPFFCGFT